MDRKDADEVFQFSSDGLASQPLAEAPGRAGQMATAPSRLSRRAFLQRSSLAVAGAAFLPPVFARAAHALRETGSAGRYGSDTILVVVQMSGGNDGLNTVVPYGLDGYAAARPTLGIKETEVLPLTDSLGLHPALEALHGLYQQGQVAIVQGIGYPNPNLSHFRSMDIWHTAAPDTYESTGWLANYLHSTNLDEANPMYAASITNGLTRAVYGHGAAVPTFNNLVAYQFQADRRYPDDRDAQLGFVNWLYGLDYRPQPLHQHVARTGANAIASSENVQSAASSYASAVEYPTFPLGRSLKTVAQLIAGDLGTRIFYVAFGGFDTHSAQFNTHAGLLGGFANSVSAFLADVSQLGAADQVLLLTFSEFGRRVRENGSQGTDHGTAGPMFAIGPRVRGGLYGDHPSLTDLDNGNLRFGVDFRAVYGTVLDGWLGADQAAALGARYENVGFV